MDFALSDTQQAFKEEISEFVESEILDESKEWHARNFPSDVYSELGDIGLLGMTATEDVGGSDLDSLTAGVLFEELGRGDISLASLVLEVNLVCEILGRFGGDYHHDLVEEFVSGNHIPCFALTEPDSGSDAQSLETTARKDGDEWVITGRKTAITGGFFGDYCMVYAREEGDDEIYAYLVDLDQEAVEVQDYPGMGLEVSGWSQLYFDDATAPLEAKVGDESGFKMAMQGFNISRAWIALYCLGGAEQTLDETIEYVQEREAFGKPLAKYEGPQFEIAEHQTKIDCARLKAYETLWKATTDRPHAKDAAMVKWFAPEVASEAIWDCLILHGHYGYSTDFGIEKRLRDVIGLQIGDGTPHIQKLIIARETFGEEYLPY